MYPHWSRTNVVHWIIVIFVLKFNYSIKWMPWLECPKKDVLICDKPGGVDKKRYNSRISEWVNLIWVIHIIRNGRTHCELKYLSSNGKEIKRDSLSSDERNGNSPNRKNLIDSIDFTGYGITLGRLLDPIFLITIKRSSWEAWPKKVKVLYFKMVLKSICYILSRIGHEKSGLNKGGPPSKAK